MKKFPSFRTQKIPDSFKFSNNNFIFIDDRIILPWTPEGQQIEEIFKLQKQNRKLNEKQKQLFNLITNAKNSRSALEILIKRKQGKKPVIRNPTPLNNFKFSNGNFIFREDTLIDPKSLEGKVIEKILQDQRDEKKIESELKKGFEQLQQISDMTKAIEYLVKKGTEKPKSVKIKGFQPHRRELEHIPSSEPTTKLHLKKSVKFFKPLAKLLGPHLLLTSFVAPTGAPRKKVPKQGLVVMRLKKIKVIDWSGIKKIFWWERTATVYVLTTVSDGSSKNPMKLDLQSFTNVKRGEELPIDELGVLMYKKKGIVPSLLDIRIRVFRSNKNSRELGKTLTKVTTDERFDDALSTLSTLAGGPIGAIINQIDFITEIIGEILKKQKDEELLLYPITVVRDIDGYDFDLKCNGNRFAHACFNVQSKPPIRAS